MGILLDAVAQAQATVPPDLRVGPDFFRFSHEPELVRLLTRHGFHSITARELSFLHAVTSPDELWHGLLGGTVRTLPSCAPNPSPCVSESATRSIGSCEAHRAGDGFEVPVSVKLAVAQGRRARLVVVLLQLVGRELAELADRVDS